MAIQLVTFDNKENLNTEQDVPRINKVIDDDMNQLKNVANTNANNVGNMEQLNNPSDSLVGALNVLNYNVVTNGQAVKTGRKIDGKDEYVKRYQGTVKTISGQVNTKAQAKMPLGFNLTDVTIVEMKGYIASNTNNIFNLDTTNFNAGNNYMVLSPTENNITVNCSSINYSNTVIVMLYYTIN